MHNKVTQVQCDDSYYYTAHTAGLAAHCKPNLFCYFCSPHEHKAHCFFPSLFKHLYKLTVFPLRHKLFLVFLWREPRQNDLFCPLSDRRLSSAYFTHKILSKTLTPAHTLAHSFCTLITAITENHSNTVHCQRERGKRSPLVRCTEKQLKNVNEGLLKFSHSQTVEHQHKQRARYSQALIYRQDQEDRQREREKQRDNAQI